MACRTKLLRRRPPPQKPQRRTITPTVFLNQPAIFGDDSPTSRFVVFATENAAIATRRVHRLHRPSRMCMRALRSRLAVHELRLRPSMPRGRDRTVDRRGRLGVRQRHGRELLREPRVEVLDRHHFRTRDEARIAVFDYLETWYNPRRRHSSLGYLAPLEFERRFAEVAIT